MSTIREIIKSADATPGVLAEVKENLKTLSELAEMKAEFFKKDIELDLKTGKTTDDLKIPITKVVQTMVEYRGLTADTQGSVLDRVRDAITGMISDHSTTGIISGITNSLSSVMDALMGTGMGEEMTRQAYTVVTDYPAIVRFDFAFWSRQVSAESIRKHCEVAFSCVAYKSAVDVSKLAFNDFLAVYGPILNAGFGSDKSKVKEMINQAKEVYAMYTAPVNTSEEEALAIVQANVRPRPAIGGPAVKAAIGNF